MESLELYGDNGIIFNSVAKAFREAHLEKSVKFEATAVDDLPEKFKEAVKKQYDAKHLDDASAVLIFYENQSQPAEQEDETDKGEETPAEETPDEGSSTEETTSPDEEKPEETTSPENDNGEEKEKEGPPAKEDEKKDGGENKEEKKKVDESLVEIDSEIPTWAAKVTGAVNSACGFSDCDKEYTKKALLATLISICGGEAGLCECLDEAKGYFCGKSVNEAEMTATGADLQKKILDTVKRVMFSDELEISPLNDYTDKNVSFIKLPIKEMNG